MLATRFVVITLTACERDNVSIHAPGEERPAVPPPEPTLMLSFRSTPPREERPLATSLRGRGRAGELAAFRPSTIFYLTISYNLIQTRIVETTVNSNQFQHVYSFR